MKKIRVCVVGYGNVGREAVEALGQTPDMELAGVIRRATGEGPAGIPVATGVESFGPVDAVLLTIPSQIVPEQAPLYLRKGINTIDGYDLQGEAMVELRQNLDRQAREGGAVAVTGAGWDPGTDSIIRMLFSAIAPVGITWTDFGPGISMGHSTMARAIPGVRDAVAVTLPLGCGKHRRDIYVTIEQGANFSEIAAKIKADPLFKSSRTEVIRVDRLTPCKNRSHAVRITRTGSSGSAHNQLLELKMRITNPAAAAQIMISAARATMRLQPGSYLLGEIPPIDLLPGSREAIIRKMV